MRKGHTASHNGRCTLPLTVLSLFIATITSGQQLAYESPAQTKFLLYTPPGYSTNSADYPLLVSLHSKGEVGDDLTKLTSNNREQMPSRLIYLNRWPADLPFVVLTPQLKPDVNDPEIQWSAEYINEVVDYVLANFRIDEQRIYLTGISRGGTGAWTYASAFPEKIAAMVPISGRSDLTQACPVKNIPVWAFHGDGDAVAPVTYSIDMVNAIKACEPRAFTPRLTIMNARDHNGWNELYNGTSGYNIWSWLLAFRKHDTSNKKPYVDAGRDVRMQLRSASIHLIGDFFDWDGKIVNVKWTQISGTPLTLSGVATEYLQITEPKAGTFEFQLIVTDDKGASGTDIVRLDITSSSVTPAITHLVLLDGKTNTVLRNLSEGDVIDKRALGISEINIQAVASEGTASVRFSVNADDNTRLRNTDAYFIKTQTSYPEWQIIPGTYLICATPYPKTYASGTPGISQCYKVIVTDGVTSTQCPGAGTITRELWTGIAGRYVSSIPVNASPSAVTELIAFETPRNSGDNYGSRVRGYVCAPTTGNYVFWIASDDTGELWLSTDENPVNKRKIASVSGWTNFREWSKYTSQQSASINLVAGRRYYIEALLKEATGGDHLSVGWTLPDATMERPIPGSRLIPFTGTKNIPTISITSPTDGQTFSAPASVTIAAQASVEDGNIVRVEFYNGTSKLGEDITAPYTFAWNNVVAGSYTLSAKAIDNAGSASTATVTIRVTETTSSCAAGNIQQEVWSGVTGRYISSIPLDSPPSSTSLLTSFETPHNIAENYGSRVRGYVCVPSTGNYTFWIASDDTGELWLSSDENPLNKRKIAYVSGWTRPGEWTKYTTQQSTTIALVGGRKYYIEALLKEATGGDHLAIGWRLPNGTLERPIPGHRLSPYATADENSIAQRRVSEDLFQVYPNPVLQRDASDLHFTLTQSDARTGIENRIEIIGARGEVVFSTNLVCESDCKNGLSFQLHEPLSPGVYLVTLILDGKRFSRRLLVR